ncbi:MAG: right-handed parallel beta-helix repeat-containing protein [Pyrinomonadaceae bacterium]|nr:right-handed parallel beta-helix repeat-containing protein [Pyrinomonadaceae bacterium]
MKRCPSCQQVYTDATLNFCLDDGAPLVEDTAPPFDSAATLVGPPPTPSDIHRTPGSYSPTPPPAPDARTQPIPRSAPATNAAYGAPTLPGYPGTQPPAPQQGRSFLPWIVGGILLFLFGAVIVGALVVYSVISSSSRGASSPTSTGTREIIVSKLGGGQYTSISEAIKNAPLGARISVRPGVYNESIEIDRDVEIVGDGPITQIIVEATDNNCVYVKSGKVLIRGLTLRNRMTNKTDKYYAVTASGGELNLEDCDVTSAALTGVGIYGAGTKGFIRRCRIHDCAESGVYFYRNSSGLVEDCDLFNNGFANVSVKEAADPTVRNSRIYNSKSSGVYVYLNGKGTVEDCRIYGNTYSGVSISEGGDPLVNRCKINGNGYNAVYAYKNARGTVQNSDLTGNKQGPFDIETGSTVRMSGNTQ